MDNVKTLRVSQDAMATFGDAISAAIKVFEERAGLTVGTVHRKRMVHYNRVAYDRPVMDGDISYMSLTDIDDRAILVETEEPAHES